jgi:hypothetical protein
MEMCQRMRDLSKYQGVSGDTHMACVRVMDPGSGPRSKCRRGHPSSWLTAVGCAASRGCCISPILVVCVGKPRRRDE